MESWKCTNKLVYLTKVISRNCVDVVTCFFQTDYNQMWEKINKLKKGLFNVKESGLAGFENFHPLQMSNYAKIKKRPQVENKSRTLPEKFVKMKLRE